MSRHFTLTLALLFMVLGTGPGLLAQPHQGSPSDPSSAFEVTGIVVEFAAGLGSGMPYLVVDDPALGAVVVALGPYWYLQQAGFGAEAGDDATLLAYPCSACPLPAVAAWVENLTQEVLVELRDELGYPLWMAFGGGHGWHPRCDPGGVGPQQGGNGQGGNGPGDGSGPGDGGGPGGNGPGDGGGAGAGGNGPGNGPDGGQCNWNGPDMGAVRTVAGTVVEVHASPGDRGPHMLFDTGEDELDLELTPFHPIVAAGLLLEQGMELVVTIAPATVGGESVWMVISLTDPAAGLTVQLRDPETGYPIYGGGH